jgi:hypothetical protein
MISRIVLSPIAVISGPFLIDGPHNASRSLTAI